MRKGGKGDSGLGKPNLFTNWQAKYDNDKASGKLTPKGQKPLSHPSAQTQPEQEVELQPVIPVSTRQYTPPPPHQEEKKIKKQKKKYSDILGPDSSDDDRDSSDESEDLNQAEGYQPQEDDKGEELSATEHEENQGYGSELQDTSSAQQPEYHTTSPLVQATKSGDLFKQTTKMTSDEMHATIERQQKERKEAGERERLAAEHKKQQESGAANWWNDMTKGLINPFAGSSASTAQTKAPEIVWIEQFDDTSDTTKEHIKNRINALHNIGNGFWECDRKVLEQIHTIAATRANCVIANANHTLALPEMEKYKHLPPVSLLTGVLSLLKYRLSRGNITDERTLLLLPGNISGGELFDMLLLENKDGQNIIQHIISNSDQNAPTNEEQVLYELFKVRNFWPNLVTELIEKNKFTTLQLFNGWENATPEYTEKWFSILQEIAHRTTTIAPLDGFQEIYATLEAKVNSQRAEAEAERKRKEQSAFSFSNFSLPWSASKTETPSTPVTTVTSTTTLTPPVSTNASGTTTNTTPDTAAPNESTATKVGIGIGEAIIGTASVIGTALGGVGNAIGSTETAQSIGKGAAKVVKRVKIRLTKGAKALDNKAAFAMVNYFEALGHNATAFLDEAQNADRLEENDKPQTADHYLYELCELFLKGDEAALVNPYKDGKTVLQYFAQVPAEVSARLPKVKLESNSEGNRFLRRSDDEHAITPFMALIEAVRHKISSDAPRQQIIYPRHDDVFDRGIKHTENFFARAAVAVSALISETTQKTFLKTLQPEGQLSILDELIHARRIDEAVSVIELIHSLEPRSIPSHHVREWLDIPHGDRPAGYNKLLNALVEHSSISESKGKNAEYNNGENEQRRVYARRQLTMGENVIQPGIPTKDGVAREYEIKAVAAEGRGITLNANVSRVGIFQAIADRVISTYEAIEIVLQLHAKAVENRNTVKAEEYQVTLTLLAKQFDIIRGYKTNHPSSPLYLAVLYNNKDFFYTFMMECYYGRIEKWKVGEEDFENPEYIYATMKQCLGEMLLRGWPVETVANVLIQIDTINQAEGAGFKDLDKQTIAFGTGQERYQIYKNDGQNDQNDSKRSRYYIALNNPDLYHREPEPVPARQRIRTGPAPAAPAIEPSVSAGAARDIYFGTRDRFDTRYGGRNLKNLNPVVPIPYRTKESHMEYIRALLEHETRRYIKDTQETINVDVNSLRYKVAKFELIRHGVLGQTAAAGLDGLVQEYMELYEELKRENHKPNGISPNYKEWPVLAVDAATPHLGEDPSNSVHLQIPQPETEEYRNTMAEYKGNFERYKGLLSEALTTMISTASRERIEGDGERVTLNFTKLIALLHQGYSPIEMLRQGMSKVQHDNAIRQKFIHFVFEYGSWTPEMHKAALCYAAKIKNREIVEKVRLYENSTDEQPRNISMPLQLGTASLPATLTVANPLSSPVRGNLLSAQADLDHKGNSLLHLAARHGANEIVDDLFELSAQRVIGATVDKQQLIESVNQDGETPLHVAVKNGAMVVVNTLTSQIISLSQTLLASNTRSVLRKQAKNGQDGKGDTPLHAAIRAGNIGMVEAILHAEDGRTTYQTTQSPLALTNADNTADITDRPAASTATYTPLGLAMALGHTEIVQLFVNAISKKDGYTQYKYGMCDADIKILQTLVDDITDEKRIAIMSILPKIDTTACFKGQDGISHNVKTLIRLVDDKIHQYRVLGDNDEHHRYESEKLANLMLIRRGLDILENPWRKPARYFREYGYLAFTVIATGAGYYTLQHYIPEIVAHKIIGLDTSALLGYGYLAAAILGVGMQLIQRKREPIMKGIQYVFNSSADTDAKGYRSVDWEDIFIGVLYGTAGFGAAHAGNEIINHIINETTWIDPDLFKHISPELFKGSTTIVTGVLLSLLVILVTTPLLDSARMNEGIPPM